MASNKRSGITTDQVISTLVYIRNLSDALIATLMANAGADSGSLPAPVYMPKPYAKACPPPPNRKECLPPEGGETTPVRVWAKSCQTYDLIGPVKSPKPAARARRAK